MEQGRPFRMIKDGKEIGDFAVKGGTGGYCFVEKYMYIGVNATSLGYKNTPDYYLCKVDRDTQTKEIINDNFIYPFSMAYNINDNLLYSLVRDENRKTDRKDFYKTSIDVHTNQGKFVKTISLPNIFGNSIHINSNGIAFISFGDVNENSDSENCILAMDLKTEKIIGKILTQRATDKIAVQDNYLFAANYFANSISVINMETLSLVDNIENLFEGGKGFVEDIVALKSEAK